MLEEFKDIYDIHRWLRYLTWIGLLDAALFLAWTGGLPPAAWKQAVSALSQLSRQQVLPLLWLFLQAALWLIAWSLLLWACLYLAHHHWRKLRPSSVSWMPSQQAVAQEVWQGILDNRVDTYDKMRNVDDEASRIETTKVVVPAFHLEGEQRTVDNDATIPMQRLRLPQRSQKLQQPAPQAPPVRETPRPATGHTPRPAARIVEPEELIPAGYLDLEDIPTVPVGHSSSTATLTRKRTAVASPRPAQPMEVGVGWNSGLVRRRQPNEDSLVVLQGTCTYNGRLVPFGLFVVADGMGGHAYGQEASRLAVQNMMQTVLHNIMPNDELNDEALTDILVDGVEQANLAICARSRELGKEMGTTLTAALVVAERGYIVNVGDSRTYLYREGERLSQITRDHSLVARLVAVGAITPDEVYTHPERNKVFRSIGHDEGVEVDWFTVDLRPRDCLLLCSDGLWEMVRDPEIERLLSCEDEPTLLCNALVDAALANGGADNVSVIVVRVS